MDKNRIHRIYSRISDFFSIEEIDEKENIHKIDKDKVNAKVSKSLEKSKNKQKKIEKLGGIKPGLWLIFILIFALVLRLIFFVGVGYNDDSYYLEFAETIYKGNKFIPPPALSWGIRIGVFLPVVFMWKLFGISELSTSFYFILTSLGSIIVTYYIAREFFDEKIGLISALLLAIFPMNIVYSTQIGPDIPFQFFSGMAFLFFIWGEKKKKYTYSFLSGILLGVSYLVKETIILFIILFASYVILRPIFNKKFFSYFSRKDILRYFLLFLGLMVIFSIQILYFYNLTGVWFYGEKARQYSFTHDLNKNSDLMWYPRVMFNFDTHYFDWIHSVPMFGFMYYFVVLSVVYLILKRDKNSFLLIFWLLLFFIFFEYGLQFYCTEIMDYCLYSRHPRFLSILSIPAVILTARLLNLKIGKCISLKSILSIICLLFLLVTSLFYAYQSSVFLGNGMNDIQYTAEFIQGLDHKPIYVPDEWSVSKLKFFFKYDDIYINNLRVYECGRIDCKDPYYNNGEYISDAYVVTWLNPYNEINIGFAYPEFMRNPPSDWILLKTIKLKNYGIFEKYDPMIYYVPKK